MSDDDDDPDAQGPAKRKPNGEFNIPSFPWSDEDIDTLLQPVLNDVVQNTRYSKDKKLMQTPAQLDPISGKAVRVNSTLVLWTNGAAIMNRTLTKCVEQKKVLTAKHYKQWVHNHLLDIDFKAFDAKRKQSGGFDDGRNSDFYQQFDELQDLWRDHINGEQKSATGKAAAAADIRAFAARSMIDDDLKDPNVDKMCPTWSQQQLQQRRDGKSATKSAAGAAAAVVAEDSKTNPQHMMAAKAVQFQENMQAKSASKQAKAEQRFLKAFKSYREFGGTKSVDEYLAEARGGVGGAGGNASVDQ